MSTTTVTAETAVDPYIDKETLRQLMQPGLQPAQLGDWSAAQQRCYAAMDSEFGAGSPA